MKLLSLSLAEVGRAGTELLAVIIDVTLKLEGIRISVELSVGSLAVILAVPDT